MTGVTCQVELPSVNAADLAADTGGPAPPVPLWDQVDDQRLLDHLPRIEAVRDQVDDDLRDWRAGATCPGTGSAKPSA